MAVLYVEDDPLLLMTTASLLRADRFDVIEAQNADVALDHLEKRPGIEIVVTDVRMPGSMDGIGLVRRVRAEQPHLPVVIVSGEITARHIPHIAHARLTKPVDHGLLVATIRRLLGAA